MTASSLFCFLNGTAWGVLDKVYLEANSSHPLQGVDKTQEPSLKKIKKMMQPVPLVTFS